MQIANLEVMPLALPFRRRYRTATGELDARQVVVVRIWTADGRQGLGEAVPLSLRGGPGLEQIVAELRACAVSLVGVDLRPIPRSQPEEIRGWIQTTLAGLGATQVCAQTLAALDIALHDLAGRLKGLPVWRLLGADEVERVHCNATLDAGDPADCAELAAEQAAAGFETFKIKVGIREDRERVAAVREAVGGTAKIRIDANGAWSPEQAIEMMSTLQSEEIELVEQPCASLAGLAAVRARTPVLVVADESVASFEDAEAASAAAACDAATLKLAKVGGPLRALRIASAIPSYLSSALDGPIGISAGLHTAQALPRGGFASGFAHGLATLGMFTATYAPSAGLLAPELSPPLAPGLGVELDEDALQELRIP